MLNLEKWDAVMEVRAKVDRPRQAVHQMLATRCHNINIQHCLNLCLLSSNNNNKKKTTRENDFESLVTLLNTYIDESLPKPLMLSPSSC